MMSPVRFDRGFQLLDIPENQFCLLGPEQGNKSVLHTAFLAKPVGSVELTTQEPKQLNGFCRYSFVQDAGGICGFIIQSPVFLTRVKNICVVVGSESDQYTIHNHLEPQGVLILESTDSNILFVAMRVCSPLLVKVDV